MTVSLTTTRLAGGEMQSALSTLAALRRAVPIGPERAVLPTGYSPLDDVLAGGLRPGELLVVGGKPGVGKTVACLQWARAMAQQGAVAVYLCYEHDPVTLVARLLACELREEAMARGWLHDVALDELQGRLRDVAAGTLALPDALESHPLLLEAERRLAMYADRLVLFRGSGTRTDLRAVADAIGRFAGEPVALFVDYVQKVPVPHDVPTEAERVSRVIEGLKEMALEREVAVIAVSAADRWGLTARRLHLHHFRGSTALAYEADAALVLNEKVDVVAKAHVAHSANRIDEFRRRVVFSVEKNRNGVAGIDLEFAKDFSAYRFDPHGSWVAERLWSEGSLDE